MADGMEINVVKETKNIVGICGPINSGKGAASEYLQNNYNFQHMSFADSLKECVASVFGWEFELLRGATAESRTWREEIDPWWANRLGIPDLTPRWILQYWGTEVCRNGFHKDIWLASLERKLSKTINNIVVDDCRFANEIEAIRTLNGRLILVNRGSKPKWYETAMNELLDPTYCTGLMAKLYPDVHISEWGWVNQQFDTEIENNGTLADLHEKIDDLFAKGFLKM